MLRINYNKELNKLEASGNIECEIGPTIFSVNNYEPKKSLTISLYWNPEINQEVDKELDTWTFFKESILSQLDTYLEDVRKFVERNKRMPSPGENIYK